MIWRTNKLPNKPVVNAIILEDTDNAFVIVSSDIYEQAIRISERLDGNPERVMQSFGTNNTTGWSNNTELFSIEQQMTKDAPQCLKCLIPFIVFCKDATPEEWNRDTVYGYLQQMSMKIDFNLILLADQSVRSSARVPGFILDAYKDKWKFYEDEYNKVVQEPILATKVVPVIQEVVASAPVVEETKPVVNNNSNITTSADPVAEVKDTKVDNVEPTKPVQETKPVSDKDEQDAFAAYMKKMTAKMAQQAEVDVEKDKEEEAKRKKERDEKMSLAASGRTTSNPGVKLNDTTNEAKETFDILKSFADL